MTTAFAHVVRGHFGRAIAVQPAGTIVALLCIVATAVAAYAAFYRSTTGPIPSLPIPKPDHHSNNHNPVTTGQLAMALPAGVLGPDLNRPPRSTIHAQKHTADTDNAAGRT